MDRNDGRTCPIAGRNLFQRQRIGNRTEIGAAPFFRHQHSEKAKLSHFAEFCARKGVVPVACGSTRRKPFLCELPGSFANLLLRVVQEHQTILSMPTAVASPPPRQMPATPRFRPWVSRAESRVTRMRAPDAPIGWPRAQAPP